MQSESAFSIDIEEALFLLSLTIVPQVEWKACEFFFLLIILQIKLDQNNQKALVLSSMLQSSGCTIPETV